MVEKTTDFTILFLFSMGVTKGKWGTLVNALLDFKRDYDVNAPLEQVLPGLVEAHAERYGGHGLRDLADEMFTAMRELRTTELMSKAFSILPKPELTPVEAYERLVRNTIESLPIESAAGRILRNWRGALSAGHPAADARGECRASQRAAARLPRGAGGIRPAFSRLWPRHPWRRSGGWPLPSSVRPGTLRGRSAACNGDIMTAETRKIGLFPATMLVAGNMMGSGVFLLPTSLAKIGSISLFGWGVTIIGSLLLTFVSRRNSADWRRRRAAPMPMLATTWAPIWASPDQRHLLVRQLDRKCRAPGRRGRLLPPISYRRCPTR